LEKKSNQAILRRFVIASSFLYELPRESDCFLAGALCDEKPQVFELPENACFSKSQELYGLFEATKHPNTRQISWLKAIWMSRV